MTINSSTRIAGPYTGNGSTTAYPFSFKVFSTAEVTVVQTNLSLVETTLTLGTNYTVSLNANQNSNPGGTVNMVTAPAAGFKITLTSSLTYTQTLDLTNQGGFYPSTINDALDRATIQIQQLNEQVGRAAKVNISAGTDATTLVSNINTVAANLSTIQSVNSNQTNINTVSSNSGNINTVSTNSSNISTVAGNIPAINTTASNITAIQNASTNAANAASSASSASTSASSASTSASNAASSASSAVAAQIAAEAAKDATLAAYDSFDDRYLGAKSSDPAVDNDGNPLIAGSLYFNTVVPEMRLYTGSAWVAAYVSGSSYLIATNNLSDVPNATTARTNIGAAKTGSNSDISSITGLTTALSPAYGGTGILNNSAATVTSSGNFAYTRTLTGATNVTFPIAGTLATLSGSESLSNKTLTNPSINNYTEGVVSIGTVTTSNTIVLTNGTVQIATLTASTACTFTLPTPTTGKSFILLLKQATTTGNGTATFSSVKWGASGAPTITATAGKMDILSFVADGTSWYGSTVQGYTP